MTADASSTGRLLKRAQYRNHRAADRALRELGTTLVQWDALRAISEAPAASGHELANATFQSDQAFGTLAERLVRQGLIVRTSGKGRRVEHRLTTAGAELLERGRGVTADVVGRSFAALSEHELSMLHALLERVGEPLD